MAETLAQPLPFRQLLDEGVKLARRHFRAIYLPVAVPVAVAGGLMPLMQITWFRQMATTSKRPDPSVFFGAAGPFFASLVLWILVFALGNSALLTAAVDAVAARPISMARAWLMLARPRFLGTLVLSWLAFGLGFMCCLLPGIYLALIYGLVVPVMVEEGLFGPSALGRSWKLTRYNPTRRFGDDPCVKVFLVLFVGWLIAYALSFTVQLPFMVVQQVLMFRSVASGQKVDPAEMMASLVWLQVPSSILGMLVQTAVQLYVAFGLALVYFDIRHRKEGTDLEAAIDRLVARGPEPTP